MNEDLIQRLRDIDTRIKYIMLSVIDIEEINQEHKGFINNRLEMARKWLKYLMDNETKVA